MVLSLMVGSSGTGCREKIMERFSGLGRMKSVLTGVMSGRLLQMGAVKFIPSKMMARFTGTITTVSRMGAKSGEDHYLQVPAGVVLGKCLSKRE